jgi:hypothetical protein
MLRTLLAAAAAVALFAGTPARACPDCKNCPHHQVAAADDKAGEKKDAADKLPACKCAGEGKECKCGAQCTCPHCAAKKAAPKAEEKKS